MMAEHRVDSAPVDVYSGERDRPGGNRGVILTGIDNSAFREHGFTMYESCDTHGWIETTAPSGFSAYDSTLFGCLRFSSIFPRFPLSIAFPAWSHPTLELDEQGFGSVQFKGAFTMRRILLPRHLTRRRDIHDFAIEQFQARRNWRAAFDPIAAGHHDDLRSSAHRPDLCEEIPRANLAGAIDSDQMQEIFFTTSFEPTLWTFTRRRDDIDDDRARDFLHSIAWLDPIWFAAYPAL